MYLGATLLKEFETVLGFLYTQKAKSNGIRLQANSYTNLCDIGPSNQHISKHKVPLFSYLEGILFSEFLI